jgi:hypothetical protein
VPKDQVFITDKDDKNQMKVLHDCWDCMIPLDYIQNPDELKKKPKQITTIRINSSIEV